MPKSGKFGTFGGVYTPSILTILGVIMYMRLGWVVGNAGTLTTVILIIMMAHVVSITTGLSVSSIATDKKKKAGGIYYMLSRSLGFPIGGAIGVTLFVATALSIALYLIGFGESVLLVLQDGLDIEEITTNHLRIVGSLALLMIVTIAFISTSIAIKTQYFILAAIVLSLISIFLGTTEGKGFDVSGVMEEGKGFAELFGVFFPAVTGFTAGVAMSGDLRDSKKSIPWGTMLAVATGLIVYVGLALFLFHSIPLAELQKNNNALVEFGWIPELVIAGIWGATLSSALGGILGGPRILQAMSIDGITPRIFGKGVGKDNEPRNALIFTFILAEAGILIGELDVIAEVVAMFYLAAYMFINLSAFLEQWASPDFQPSFKINIFIPLLGAIATLLLMIQLNIAATIASVVIILLIFLWLTRKQLELGTGDVWQNVWSSIVKFGLKNLNKGDVHKRNWEPNILLFSGGTQARPYLLEFSTSIAGRNGMISNFDLIEDKSAKVLFPKQKQSILGQEHVDDGIFYRKKTCQNLYDGIEMIASTYGFSGVEPNTVLMGWVRNTKDPLRFSEMTNILHQLDYNILFLDYDKKRGFGKKQKIDIWWRDLSQISYFTVQLVKLIHASPDWSGAEVRFLYYDIENNERAVLEQEMQKRVDTLRTKVEIKVVNNLTQGKAFYEVVKDNSFEADLIIIDLPELGKRKAKGFIDKTNELLDILGTTLIVKASSQFYEETTFNTELEKKYASGKSQVALAEEAKDNVALGRCNYELLSQPIEQLDGYLHQLNADLGEQIYSKYADVIFTCLTLLKLKAGVSDAFQVMSNLVEDVRDNRLGKISNHLATALNEQFGALGFFIDQMPQKVIREYLIGELIDKFGDTKEVQHFKRSIKRIPTKSQSTIHLRKIVNRYFNNAYLSNFEQHLHYFGESSLLFNAILKKWTPQLEKVKNEEELSGVIDGLKAEMENVLIKEKKYFINELNGLGRKFCNTIIKKVDRLNNEHLLVLDGEKRSHSMIKETKTRLINYPAQWQQNTVYLTNQLLLNLKLQALRLKIKPIIVEMREELISGMLQPSGRLISKIYKNINELTEEKIEKYEHQLIDVGAIFNIDESMKEVMHKIDDEVKQSCGQAEVISSFQMEDFGRQQMDIVAEKIDVKKVTEYLIDNEIIVGLKTGLQVGFNEIKSELLKIENALRLLKYSLSSNQSDKKVLLVEVQARVGAQLKESKQLLEEIRLRIEQQISNTLNQFEHLMNDEIIVHRAFQTNGIIHKERTRKGLKRYASQIGDFFEKANNQLDNTMIKVRDLWTISDHKYRVKNLQNPHARLANYVGRISLSSKLKKNIPFFYLQLFTGKHSAPLKPVFNRKSELATTKQAIERFNEGVGGAILFTGEPLSGLTYLIENVNNAYIKKKVIYVKSPTRHNRKPEKVIHEALVFSTGLHLELEAILGRLPTGTVVVFEDLELWWTRRNGGSNFIIFINELIAQFGHRILFMLSCNIYFYQHIRQYIDLDAHLLETIMINPMPIQEIKKIILKRHHSGGLSYTWNGKLENNLRVREQNKLFKRLTTAADGNIGAVLYNWLGSISKVGEGMLTLEAIELGEIPPVLSSEWEIMLLQVLLHKRLSLRRLYSIYGQETQKTSDVLQSLLRTKLLIETPGKRIQINPYVLPYLIKYFRRNELI